MASNIISNTIDEEYPVAGQDNDSQGFRDNFSVIKTGLTVAADEITDLQATRARLDDRNDFNGNNIEEANLLMTTEEVRNNGALIASQNISFEAGHYQTVQVGASITLTLSDWPDSGVMGRIRVLLTKDNTADTRTVTWSVSGGGTLKTNSTFPDPFELTQTNFSEPVVVDFWTTDGGLVVYGQYHGAFSS